MGHSAARPLVVLFISFLLLPNAWSRDDDVSMFDGKFAKLERHKRNYFISGKPDTKIAFSGKFSIIEKLNLYAGYSQLMFWELFIKESSPMSDINYNPELFYRMKFGSNQPTFVDLGVEHLSNGRDHKNSRSWNSMFVYVNQRVSIDDIKMAVALKAFKLFDSESTNKDAQKKLGYMELEFVFKNIWRSAEAYEELYVRVIPGQSFPKQINHGAIEVGARFKAPFIPLHPHLYVQYYKGYYEKQLEYNIDRESYRIGVAF